MAERHVDHLLIGGGLAAGNCARWLREEGGDGSILLVGREPDLPYNRPPCSKEYLRGAGSREEVLFRPADWYDEQQVEALTRVSVMKLDLEARRAELSNRDTVAFDKALLATGANVRRMSVPGCELTGIHYLRTLRNSDAIRDDAAGKQVVLVDSRLETQVPGVYAAGDIAAYDSVVHRRRLRVEHWDVAFNMGKTVALNMLGRDQPHDVVPYFFSDLSDWASLEYVGPAAQWDQEVVRGSMDESAFSVFYLDQGRVAAALSVGRSDDIDQAKWLMTSRAFLGGRAEELADLSTDLSAL